MNFAFEKFSVNISSLILGTINFVGRFQGKANDTTREFRTARSQKKIIVCPYWLEMVRRPQRFIYNVSFCAGGGGVMVSLVPCCFWGRGIGYPGYRVYSSPHISYLLPRKHKSRRYSFYWNAFLLFQIHSIPLATN